MSRTCSQLLAEASDLEDHQARRLLLAAAGENAAWLIGDPEVSPEVAARFREGLRRRRSGEPLQYVEGTVHFGPLELLIDDRALIPRPETERLWELAIDQMRSEPRVVVDLCSGSGNLALAFKHVFPNAEVYGVDISPDAVTLARVNAARTGLAVDFMVGDLFAGLPPSIRRRVDLLVSNPPYIGGGEIDDLPAEVREYEPIAALEAGPTGLEVLRRIAVGAPDWLRPAGIIACEIGDTQGDACMRIFSHFGPRIEDDLTGRSRYVLGSAPERLNVH